MIIKSTSFFLCLCLSFVLILTIFNYKFEHKNIPVASEYPAKKTTPEKEEHNREGKNTAANNRDFVGGK